MAKKAEAFPPYRRPVVSLTQGQFQFARCACGQEFIAASDLDFERRVLEHMEHCALPYQP